MNKKIFFTKFNMDSKSLQRYLQCDQPGLLLNNIDLRYDYFIRLPIFRLPN